MIVRAIGDELLLITQPDHAALAATIVAEWRRDGFPELKTREMVLFATREHDNGWVEEDRAPILDDTGRVLDFMESPDPVRKRIWPRAVKRLDERPYAAALVAQHALTIFSRYRAAASWERWFARMESARRSALTAAAPLTDEDLLNDYFFVHLGDLASLIFCNAWIDPQRTAEYEIALDGSRLAFSPDPFSGREIPLTIAARKLPNRPFPSTQAARKAFEAAPVVSIRGIAVGAASSEMQGPR